MSIKKSIENANAFCKNGWFVLINRHDDHNDNSSIVFATMDIEKGLKVFKNITKRPTKSKFFSHNINTDFNFFSVQQKFVYKSEEDKLEGKFDCVYTMNFQALPLNLTERERKMIEAYDDMLIINMYEG